MVDEERLLRRLKQKDENSLERAIVIYTPYLSTVLFNKFGNRISPEDTEEIISDVFVALWKNAEYIDTSKGTMRSYLAAVAGNFALKRLGKTKECGFIDGFEPPDLKNDIDEIISGEFLWKSVMQLGEPDNEIFVRYYKFGERLKDISAETGIKLSTVKTKLLRGKRKLKKIILNSEGLL